MSVLPTVNQEFIKAGYDPKRGLYRRHTGHAEKNLETYFSGPDHFRKAVEILRIDLYKAPRYKDRSLFVDCLRSEEQMTFIAGVYVMTDGPRLLDRKKDLYQMGLSPIEALWHLVGKGIEWGPGLIASIQYMESHDKTLI
jgi:hypothetical protein